MTTMTNPDELEMLRTSARVLWHAADQAHIVIRGATLGRAFGMSERWGSEQAARAKAERDAGQLPEKTPGFITMVSRIRNDPTMESTWELLKYNQLPEIVGPADLRIVAALDRQKSAQDALVPIGTQGGPAPTGTSKSAREETLPIGTQDADGSARQSAHAAPPAEPAEQGVDPLAVPIVPQQRANGHLASALPVVSTSSDPLSGPVPTGTQPPAWMENYAPMPTGTQDLALIGTPESAHADTAPIGTQPERQSVAVPIRQDPLPIGTSELARESESGEPAPTPLKPLAGWTKFWFFVMTIPFIAPGLAYSAWSIYGYARTGSAPIWLAVLGSPALDGAALFCGAFAAMFQNAGQSTKLPRLGTYGAIAAGVLVNYSRAGELHHAGVGMYVLLIGPAIIASLVFEIIMTRIRHQERARREARRSTRQSARVDLDLWLRHPLLVHHARQHEARQRIQDAFPGMTFPEKGSGRAGGILWALVPAAAAVAVTLWATGRI